MPVFRSYKYETRDIGFEISMRPVGIRRCKFVRWYLPYLYGSDVEFEAVLKTNAKHREALQYDWTLFRWDGIRTNKVTSGDGEMSPTEKSRRINVGYLSVTGHHILEMRWGTDISAVEEPRSMVNFTLMDRDVYTVNWVYNLSSGIIGAIIGALIALAIII